MTKNQFDVAEDDRSIGGVSPNPTGLQRKPPRGRTMPSFPRSPWECRPGRSAAHCGSDDAERRGPHSHGDRGNDRLSASARSLGLPALTLTEDCAPPEGGRSPGVRSRREPTWESGKLAGETEFHRVFCGIGPGDRIEYAMGPPGGVAAGLSAFIR